MIPLFHFILESPAHLSWIPVTPEGTHHMWKSHCFRRAGHLINGNHNLGWKRRWSRADQRRIHLIYRLIWGRRARWPCTHHKVSTAGASRTVRAWSASPTAKVNTDTHRCPFSVNICLTHLITWSCFFCFFLTIYIKDKTMSQTYWFLEKTNQNTYST